MPERKLCQSSGRASQKSVSEEATDELSFKGRYKFIGEEVRGGREVRELSMEQKGGKAQ